jgi:hypothetical protein
MDIKMGNNVLTQHFWRKVIADYTGVRFEEISEAE